MPTTAPVPVGPLDPVHEHTTVLVPASCESAYLDAYPAFGWTPTSEPVREPGGVSLTFRRERTTGDRDRVLALQQQCTDALAEIARLDFTTRSSSTAASIGLVFAGVVLLSCATFAFVARAYLLLAVLLVLGVLSCAAPPSVSRRIEARKAAALAPARAAQTTVVHEVCALAIAIRSGTAAPPLSS